MLLHHPSHLKRRNSCDPFFILLKNTRTFNSPETAPKNIDIWNKNLHSTLPSAIIHLIEFRFFFKRFIYKNNTKHSILKLLVSFPSFPNSEETKITMYLLNKTIYCPSQVRSRSVSSTTVCLKLSWNGKFSLDSFRPMFLREMLEVVSFLRII